MAEGEEIDSLFVRLGLDSDKEEFDEADAMFSNLKTTALQFGAVIGGGVGLGALANNFADTTEEMGRFAERFSVPIEFVDELGFAFQQVGGDADMAFESIRKMSDLIEDTEWGDIPSDAFREVGFDPMLLEGIKTGAEAYERIADAVKSLPTEERRRRALSHLGFGETEIDLFTGTGGESFRSLMAEGRDLSVISSGMAEQGKEFNKASGRMAKAVDSLTKEFTSLFIDDFTEVLNEIADLLRENLVPMKDFMKTYMPFMKGAALAIGSLLSLELAKKTAGILGNIKSGKTGLVGLLAGLGYMAFSDEEIKERSIDPLLELIGMGGDDKKRRRSPSTLEFDPSRPDLPPQNLDEPRSGRSGDVNINVDARGATSPEEVRRRVAEGGNEIIKRLSENTQLDVEGVLK